MTKLMSLEDIRRFEDSLHYPPNSDMVRLIETARASHELQAEFERLNALLAIGYPSIAEIRAEERERCAEIAEKMNDPCIAEVIREEP